ncbi:hypothetical protein I302_104696 [Kwoniella bestiolae CBS 10118]|uniref:Uncharacterized protein n=1 Tax=Kwoniella bestiolae CBS 10118 TaxID=1296100 RepID=A0A1B9FS13_9TREE|nr:hypothetical protein I302_09234 [Kwoniella bestiolae CBS 10118]OCF21555.1 hypothetical protein I302_09234 [Kwoniella bestiolae CBS 10118]
MPLSRLQLAAALMEYDNDSDLASPSSNTEITYRDHRQSAIFQPYHAAQAAARRHKILSQPPPSLPSPLESSFALNRENRQSTLDQEGEQEYDEKGRPKGQNQSFRQSTISDWNFTPGSKSINLPSTAQGHGQNNGEAQEEVVDEGNDLEDVDVARWGLPSHLVADDQPIKRKPENTRRVTVNSIVPQPIPSPIGSRVRSIHVQDVLDDTDLHGQVMSQSGYSHEDHFEREKERKRNHSYDFTSNALASAARVREMVENQNRERPSTVMGIHNNNGDDTRRRQISDPRMIPLPATPGSLFDSRPLSRGWTSPPPGKMDDDVEDLEQEETLPNPFALPAPPPELGSRFDPKVLETQRRSDEQDQSQVRFHSRQSEQGHRPQPYSSKSRSSFYEVTSPTEPQFDDQPLTSPPPISRIKDPERVWEELPTPEQFGRPLMPKRYSTSARLHLNRLSMPRPKTLIMPSLLANQREPPPREIKLPEGYTLGEKPLPYGAKTEGERPRSQFHPLSLSQRTFRGSLMVNGLRDDEFVGGTENEGELGLRQRELDEGALERRPGKLYGRSLMDELEARKMAQKGRQRVFTGDFRPAMMARSTMYDPPTISFSPTSPPQAGSADRPHSMHPGDRGRAPLLSFDSNGDIHPTSPNNLGVPDAQGRIAKSKSVFGVDQLWEKEMAKLKIIQEQEKRAAEARRKMEEEKEMKRESRKLKGKGKGRESMIPPPLDIPKDISTEDVLGISPIQRAADLPPAIQYSPEKAASRPHHEEEEETEEEQRKLSLGGLFSPNSDDEDAPVPAPHDFAQTLNPLAKDEESDDDSEEDVPLSKLAPAKSGISARQSVISATGSMKPVEVESESVSDEDVPLSKLPIAPKSPSITTRAKPLSTSLGLILPSNSSISIPGIPSSSTHTRSPLSAEVDDEEAEDDLPLAVRQARARGLKPITKAEIIEDDLPLGYKHAEKAQAQMAQRAWEEDRASMVSQSQNHTQSWMGYPQMQMPHQGMMGMGMNPYGAMGFNGSMPNLNMNMGMGMGYNPYQMPQMNMNMPMGMNPTGMGMDTYGTPPPGNNPGEAIDSWRKDVALAPVPTGSGSSNQNSNSRVSVMSGNGSGSVRV